MGQQFRYNLVGLRTENKKNIIIITIIVYERTLVFLLFYSLSIHPLVIVMVWSVLFLYVFVCVFCSAKKNNVIVWDENDDIIWAPDSRSVSQSITTYNNSIAGENKNRIGPILCHQIEKDNQKP